jgi:hypothetical protein
MALKNDPVLGAGGSKAVVKALTLSSYAVAGVPAAATHKGRLIHVSNGNAGQPCLAYSDGTSWLRVAFGLAIATS